MDEDLTIFFEDFAKDVVLVDQSRSVPALIDGPLEMLALGGIEAKLYKRSLLVMTDTVLGIDVDSRIQFGGIIYHVSKALPDGTGFTFIGLTIKGDSAEWNPE